MTDVLDTFAVMKSMKVDGMAVRQTVPKNVQYLEKKLVLYIYTEQKIPKRRGRKPKSRVSVR